MNDFFEPTDSETINTTAPLAYRLRPKSLEDFIGQEHILGPGCLLRKSIEEDRLSNLLFYGPPGTGKTTLAKIIANSTKSHFIPINAVLSGIKEIREAIEIAENRKKAENKKTILFIDEVHRFNKSQQDALLPHAESGLITLIGATTENPFFEVIKALVSRSRVFEFHSLNQKDMEKIIHRALNDKTNGYGNENIFIDEDAKTLLFKSTNGDARNILNALETCVETSSEKEKQITLKMIQDAIQKRAVLYDKSGDIHYDVISAFIKSVRGSDPDSSLYWMAKMIAGGEDPKYIFRRMLVLASEDVGLADPNALVQVMNAAQAFDYVGMPEGRYHLAQACLYLATAPKSNSTMALFKALEQVKKDETRDVPNHLKDSSRDGEGLGHGKGYVYPHDYEMNYVQQSYLPEGVVGTKFYDPGELGYEKIVRKRLEYLREFGKK